MGTRWKHTDNRGGLDLSSVGHVYMAIVMFYEEELSQSRLHALVERYREVETVSSLSN